MEKTAKFYEKLNDNDELEEYITEADKLLEKIKGMKNKKLICMLML